MMVKDFSQHMEVYKELGEEKGKKTFYFVVRAPFDNYKKGDRITNPEELERIENQRLLGLVMKVNIRN